MMFDVRRYTTNDDLIHDAAAYIVRAARDSIADHGRFTWALSGGSTPRALYALLAEQDAAQIDWSRVHVFWGDERTVPPDHADSNYRMAQEALLSRVSIPAAQIHRIQGELPPEQAADAYESLLRREFGQDGRFDLVLLGMGDDGHTASLFPHTKALHERERWVVANEVPQLTTWRITLTYPAINAAARVAFLVSGAGKAARLRDVLEGTPNPDALPSQGVQPTNGELIWFTAIE